MKKKGFIISVLLIPIMLGVLMTSAEAESIKIGGPFSLTGPYAADGKTMNDAITLAIEDINAAGGVLGKPLELVIYDVEDMLPEKLNAAGEYLVTKKGCDALIVGWCGMGPDLPAFGKYDVPYLHNNHSKFNNIQVAKKYDQYWNIFQLASKEEDIIKNIFYYLENVSYEFPNKKVAIITGNVEYDLQVKAGLEKVAVDKGWEVVISEVVPYGTKEWRPILVKIRKEKPAYIEFSNLDPGDLVSFLTQFLTRPTNSILSLGYGFTIPGFLDLAGKEAEGILGYAQIGWPIISTKEGRAYMEKFKKRFGYLPGLAIATNSYDAVQIWASAVKRVGNEKDYRAIAKAIKDYSYKGIQGLYKFDPKDNHAMFGDEYLPSNLFQIQDGKYETLFVGKKKMKDFRTPPWIK